MAAWTVSLSRQFPQEAAKRRRALCPSERAAGPIDKLDAVVPLDMLRGSLAKIPRAKAGRPP
ncbi:hypothetical protein AJ88_23845 [Mesorhizobium amorphae CCBAU 01583]|nr:hypothetical protein AJ88_23845 [Mesorhizobium amorphae CCBAU 01583]